MFSCSSHILHTHLIFELVSADLEKAVPSFASFFIVSYLLADKVGPESFLIPFLFFFFFFDEP